MAELAVAAGREPHPVAFDVEYPEHVSRLTTIFRLILVIPQFIVVYALLIAFYVLTFLAWFAVLFTGRYPKGLFEFNAGVMRWSANVMAYGALLRDEYPPFSWEPGKYPVSLVIERAERQSRWRLLIRLFAIWPNFVVFYFVEIAWIFTSIFAWFAIVFTGRYPRSLFRFAVGTIRWYVRQFSYMMVLRDEYPPYSVKATARPGNEVVSAVLGVPIFAASVALQFLPFVGLLGNETDHVYVHAALTSPALAREAPSGKANGVRITLVGYKDNASPPPGSDSMRGYRFVSFRMSAEKDGFFPTCFTPFLFRLHDCDGFGYSPEAVSDGFEFKMFWRGGHKEGTVVFDIPVGTATCDLVYHPGLGKIEFIFSGVP